jgi:hypothetical protein
MNLVIICCVLEYCDFEFMCVNDWFWVYVRWVSELLLYMILVYDFFRIRIWNEVWQKFGRHMLVIKTLDK